MTDRQQVTWELLLQAHRNFGAGDLAAAEKLYLQALEHEPGNRDALQNLIAVAFKNQDFAAAENRFRQLVAAFPGELKYAEQYAELLFGRGKIELAEQVYLQLLSRNPQANDCRYNFARLLKQAGQPEAALSQYQIALNNGISGAEEVLANMGVIHGEMGREREARDAYGKALAARPGYLPALYNRALLDEECGDRSAAAAGFEQVLAVDPDYSDALARLASLDQVTEPQAGIVERLQTALGNSRDPRQQENLHYALGKAFDDLGNYRAAFEHYHQANLLTRKRSGAYQRQGTEQLFQAILEHSASAEAAAITPVSTARPIFICGMFRSGSTLLEQMLAAHSALRAGGENRFFLRHAPLPETLSLPAGRLSALGREYLESLGGSIAELGKVTNKRPDNFLHLGWLLRCFPNARVLYTHRDAMDVCLSVHFQAFAEDLGYDSDLLDIGHYYIQQHRLMEQMQARYPENIRPVDYDKLIQEPRSELEPVLAALGLPWEAGCLQFHTLGNRVNTASLWQVRRPLYQQSSGRWRNYRAESSVQQLRAMLIEAGLSA